MNFDPRYSGPEGLTRDDLAYRGSRFAALRTEVFRNAYYLTWGAPNEPPLPVYEVTLRRTLERVLRGSRNWLFQRASDRIIDSRADLRWGWNRQGFRRLLHPNGVCLTGTWEIDAAKTGYSGYFKEGSRGLVLGRYSVCCTETRSGHYRSLSLVGKVFSTLDPSDPRQLRPAHFITQEDLGGSKSFDISDVELRNAPDTTPWNRRSALPVLLLTGIVLRRTDRMPTIRQLYEIAELGKAQDEPTRAPEFMRLVAERGSNRQTTAGVDFRDEILGRIYDRGDAEPRRTLTFTIETSDEGKTIGLLVQRRKIQNWKKIGRIVFTEAVASYNGDFVLHMSHPRWRNNRNDPRTVTRRP